MTPPTSSSSTTTTTTAPSKPRSYWRWSKQDFFPEPSFQTGETYRTALANTCPRLKDRLLNRSTDSHELLVLPKASENTMTRCLTWWDLTWLAFGAVVGSGIFVVTGQEARFDAGPSIILSYAASGFSALLSALIYAEFAVEVPVAGGSFSFLRIELGDFLAFIAAGNILLEALVGAAGLGRSWSSYFATMIKNDSDYFRIRIDSFKTGFNLLDPLAVVVLLITNGIAASGTRKTSILTWLSSIVTIFIIGFIIVIGFIHGKSSNLTPFFPYGVKGVFNAAAVVYWSYTGFDMVATMAEETKNPSRDIPIGLIGSMSMITVIYCLMALALVNMVKYSEIDAGAAYSVAFVQIGMKWGKYLVSICALKGMTTSLLVGSMGQARYTTQIARSHMIPPFFALIHPKTGTPINATLLTTLSSCVVALFTSLDVLSSVFSVSTLFIFMLMAIALLVRRYYARESTDKSDLWKVLSCLFVVVGSCIVGTALWNSGLFGWIGYTVAACVWLLATLVMSLLPKKKQPKVWGVPLVPWVPSLSIATNLFLMGSLGSEAFFRFLICTGVMLLYYLFVGIHATYDVDHKIGQESNHDVEGAN
ncbi:putative amino acid/polyamine transporter I, cationic amino acid transporter [Medicago truncatula]|uniref:Putative amino acid/polyamine transporter I, cationic amino acid transporter n=1 Tax=Medicago truncatula TaxID=3880 RepID=A0A396GJV2_MEDTR|nr:cationic amino acid transporter 8, vacuolar [Medicago truncatula]RHN40813.1 putative amino acid/polyamine transporter I, cationic amino acid transporter [Medicago truncatula]